MLAGCSGVGSGSAGFSVAAIASSAAVLDQLPALLRPAGLTGTAEGIDVRGPSARVSRLDHDEALAICAKIKAKHPDILERGPDGLYRYLVAGEDLRQSLFDYLACDRGLPGQAGTW